MTPVVSRDISATADLCVQVASRLERFGIACRVFLEVGTISKLNANAASPMAGSGDASSIDGCGRQA